MRRSSALFSLVLLLAACATTGTPPTAKTPASVKKAGETRKPTKSLKVSKAPATPLPSLGLLLGGQVLVDPSRLLATGLGEQAGGGVRLLGDAGAALVSDQGLGLLGDAGAALIGKVKGELISDSGGSLLGDAGAALIGKGKADLIANNGGSLIGKVKFRIQEAPAAQPVPVQNMVVFAVSLATNEVVAGPVKTDAEGRWRLGFQAAPGENIRLMAQVWGKADDPSYNYAALVSPQTADVPLTDTSRAVSVFLIDVMRARVQEAIDARKKGEPFTIWYVGPQDQNSTSFMASMQGVIDASSPAYMTRVDKGGLAALIFSEKVLSFADLSKPFYADLTAVTADIRLYANGLPPGEGVKLMDAYVALTRQRSPVDRLPALLTGAGMAPDQAQALRVRYGLAGDAIYKDLAGTAQAHLDEVLKPFFDAGAEGPSAP